MEAVSCSQRRQGNIATVASRSRIRLTRTTWLINCLLQTDSNGVEAGETARTTSILSIKDKDEAEDILPVY